MSFNKEKLLTLSKISPKISYSVNLSKKLSRSNLATKEIVSQYFSNQPKEYLEEILEFENINNLESSNRRKVFIFVPAFNEEKNIQSLLNNYFSQKCGNKSLNKDLFEICFIINFTETGNNEVDKKNLYKFNKAIRILIKNKKKYSNINIITKIFKKGEGSLGRARKYGMDYCLWRSLSSSEKIDSSIIISNEGDTVSIPSNYISSYINYFKNKKPCFVQGRIEYPRELIDRSWSLRLFSTCRELVHNGQGVNDKFFPYFDGIMPIGRNFAVSPRICVQAGGIDPIRRSDTDDDMNFGTDIYVRLGGKFKSICDIPLTTNPRREVIIVRDILMGRSQDSKKSYENFHDNRKIYDFSLDDIIKISNDKYLVKIPNRNMTCNLINQYFQWVLRSRYKVNLSGVNGFKKIIKLHLEHKISYWEKESMLSDIFKDYFSNPSKHKIELQEKIIDEAMEWFNKFLNTTGLEFTCVKNGIKSSLR